MKRRILLIEIGPKLFLTGILPSGVLNSAYSAQVSARGGVAPYQYQLVDGALPDGWDLDPFTGIIAGTTDTAGLYTFTIEATDARGRKARKTFSIRVAAEPIPMVITGAYPDGQKGIAYSADLAISGGAAPYSNPRVVSGALPDGLGLSIVGTNLRLSGTPTADGDFDFEAAADASNGQSASTSQAISIAAAGGWTPANLAVPPAVWLNDTSQIVPGSLGDCQQWSDISGNDRDFSQTQIAQQPVIVADGQNSRRELDFDGEQDYLGGTTGCAALTNNASALTIFLAGNPSPESGSAVGRLINFSIGLLNNTNYRAGILLAANQIRAQQRRRDNDAVAFAAIAHTAKEWHVFESEHDWTAATVSLRLDGADSAVTTNTGQGSGNSAATDSTTVTIGGDSSVGGQYVTSGIAEVIVLTYIPATAVRQKIEGYMAWRRGLQGKLPADHPYKDAPP